MKSNNNKEYNKLYKPEHPLKVRLLAAIGSFLVWSIMHLLFLSCRKQIFGKEILDEQQKANNGKALGAGWHRGLLFIVYHFRKTNGVIMSSRSKDGELITGILHRFNYITPRGSSGKDKGGQQALKEFIDLINTGRPGGVAVDAPQGPPYISKHGIVKAAAETGSLICPFGWYAEPNIRFKSWDRTLMPKPFSRLVAIYDREPISVPSDSNREELEEYRQELDRRLNILTYQSDNWFKLKNQYNDPRDIPVPDPVPVPNHSRKN